MAADRLEKAQDHKSNMHVVEESDSSIVPEKSARPARGCPGECVLRRPELSRIVADSLLHFDGARCNMTDFVVMPNHAHLLAAFPDENAMLAQCDSWKHFTAAKINRKLGRSNRFWQQDGFDHLVRSLDAFDHYRRYLANNPRRARLGPGEYIHFTKE